MGRKVKVTLSIDQKVVKSAKQIGLNLSQFCENALKEAVKTLKTSTIANTEKQPVWEGDSRNSTHKLIISDGNNPISNSGAGSSARIEHHPPKVGVVGSNPTLPAESLFSQIKHNLRLF